MITANQKAYADDDEKVPFEFGAADVSGAALRLSSFRLNGKRTQLYRPNDPNEVEVAVLKQQLLDAIIRRIAELVDDTDFWLLEVNAEFKCVPGAIVKYLGRHRGTIRRRLEQLQKRLDEDERTQQLMEEWKRATRGMPLVEDWRRATGETD